MSTTRRYAIHPPQLVGRDWMDAASELQRFLRYLMDANDSAQTGMGIEGVVDGTVDHGSIGGLEDDDHEQYLKEKGSGGTAGEIPLHDHSSAAQAGQVDHGSLTGLTDDDHAQYIRVDGTRPFTGDQSMGQNSLTAIEALELDTTPSVVPTAEGSICWDVLDRTIRVPLPGGVVMQVGQEQLLLVYNDTGALLPNGAVVKVIGAQGQRVEVDLADASNHQDVHSAVGVVTEDAGIPDKQSGFVTTEGLVRNFDTSGWADGTPLYLGAAGALTSTFPAKPGNVLHVAVVVNGNSVGAGILYVRLGLGEQLEELTDVNVSSPADLDPLVYDATNLYWKNQRTFQRLHGFELDSAGAPLQTISYDKTTRKITLTPTGATFTFWIDGKKIVKTGAQVSGAHGTTTGSYFFYYDSAGTLQVSAVGTPWSIMDRTVTPVSVVYWNNSLSDGVCFYECHTADRWLEGHFNLHFSRGCQYISGYDLTGYTRLVDSDAGVTYAIGAGVIADEDIRFASSAVPDGGPYVVFYRSGAAGEWTWGSYNFPFAYGATYPQYNQWTGATWQLTEVTGGSGTVPKYMNYYVCATSAVTPQAAQAFLIPGQNQYTALASAQAETLQSLSLGTLPFEEVAPLYRVTLAIRQSYAGTYNARIEQVTSLKNQTVTVTGGSVGVTDHGALTGLGDDDHTQYQLRSEEDAANGYAGLDASGVVTAPVQLVRQGLDAAVPALAEGELYWATDTDTLYIGT